MNELLLELAKDSPWIVVTIFLLWRGFKREEATLIAYKEGAANVAPIVESLRSVTTTLTVMREALSDMREEVRACQKR